MMFQPAREAVVKTCIKLADMGYLEWPGTSGRIPGRGPHPRGNERVL